MSFDPVATAGLVTREVRSGSRAGAPTKIAVARRTYPTDQADLWDAVTSAARIPRWFTPIAGDLRVVELATGEGDRRFARIRSRHLNEVTVALADVIERTQRPSDGALDPMATAGVLVAMLAQVASHRYGFEFWGIRTDDVRRSMANLIYWSVTGRKPPA